MDSRRTNEKFHANLSNDPKVGRGLGVAATIREVRICPDDGRAKHDEWHYPATGEPFISHEGVLEPAQEGKSELVPINSKFWVVELVPLEVQSHAEIPFPGWPVWHAEVVARNGAS